MNLAQRKQFQGNFRWKDRLILFHFAWRDPAMPLFAKCMILFSIFYLLSPIDLIPDFIPVAGWIDDLVIVPLLLSLAERSLPPRVFERARYKTLQISRRLQIIFWGLMFFLILIIMASVYRFLR